MWNLSILIAGVLGTMVFPAEPLRAPMTVDDYVREVEAWREQRETRLRSPEGWLAVSGLVWLDADEFTIGKSEKCSIRLPDNDLPDHVGSLRIRDGIVTFHINDISVEVLLNGKPERSGLLRIDQTRPEADSPDVLKVGRTTLHLIRRTSQLAIRLRDPQSPLRLQFPGEVWFPVDARYRVIARYTPYEESRRIEITNVKGGKYEDRLVGFVEFELDGRSLRLDVQQESDDMLFVNFRDRTAGHQTFGAGRFLNTSLPENGTVILDFNKAYNPPCAYNTHTLCPLPPSQNHLPVDILAGARIRDPEANSEN